MSEKDMTHMLSYDGMEMSVTIPGTAGTYCGTRFSWAGIITEIN